MFILIYQHKNDQMPTIREYESYMLAYQKKTVLETEKNNHDWLIEPTIEDDPIDTISSFAYSSDTRH